MLVLSRYTTGAPTAPPTSATPRIYIATGGKPLYDLNEVLDIAENHEQIKLMTSKCVTNVQELWVEASDQHETQEHFVYQLLTELRSNGKYLKSEWCFNGKKAYVAADSYSLNRHEYIPHLKKTIQVDYYLKFSIGNNGNLVYMISCKLSNGA